MTQELLFSPASLITRLYGVKGQDLIPKVGDSIIDVAVEVAEEWTEDWEEGEGFGSSDSTYALKDYIERLIEVNGMYGELKCVFNPCLSVITKEQSEEHDRKALARADEQLKELGI